MWSFCGHWQKHLLFSWDFSFKKIICTPCDFNLLIFASFVFNISSFCYKEVTDATFKGYQVKDFVEKVLLLVGYSFIFGNKCSNHKQMGVLTAKRKNTDSNAKAKWRKQKSKLKSKMKDAFIPQEDLWV